MRIEERYRRAAAAGGVGIWDWNLQTGEIYVDPILKELLGYEDHEIGNHVNDWNRLVHPDDMPAMYACAQAHIRGDAPVFEIEHRMLHRDGSVRWFLARGSVTRDQHGAAVSMVGTDTDVTARKQGEEALRQAEELNRRIVESTGDCVKILDIEGRVLYINPEGLQSLELPDASTLLNRQIVEFFEGEARRLAEEAVALARSGGRGRFQAMLPTRSGLRKWWDIVLTPITDSAGRVVQLLAVSRDVTERKREDTLRAAQHQVLEMIATGRPLPEVLDSLIHFVERHADGMLCTILLLDEDGVTVRHGAAPSMPVGYIQGINGLEIGPRHGSCGTAMYMATRVIVSDILTDPLCENYRDVAQRFGLRACWSTPIFSPQRKVLGSFAMYYSEPRSPADEELQLIEIAADIARIAIEQQRAGQALRASEARNQAILRAIPDMMFLTTGDGVYLDFHARDDSRLLLPPERFLGRHMREVLPAPVAELFTAAFSRVRASDETDKIEYSLGIDEGERFYEACIAGCDGDKVLTIVRDITDRKHAELELDAHRRELTHLSRVALLGELSGALAHELSQPLAAVLINAQAARHLLAREPLDVDELRLAIDDIIRNDKRAGAVIDHLHVLLRKGEPVFVPVDLNEVVREVLGLAYGELVSRRITVASSLRPEMPLVLGDRVQLQQVLLNLVLNACDAMGGTPTDRRQLSMSTINVDGVVELAVSDRGSGVPNGQLERVFEPFVTFRDKGLGLGLAISRSIMNAHGGSIRAENNADGGATFRCVLPVAS